MNLSKLKNKTVFITGATGLIGSNIVKYLSFYNETEKLNTKLILFVRSKEKANNLFENCCNMDFISIYEGNIEQLISIDEKIDYIIHAANPTASKYFIQNPVETIETAIDGTKNVLKLAKDKVVQGVIYLSTMEVYGEPQSRIKITEEKCGSFDSTYIRNSYPLSKQLCETLCCSYFKEYSVPVKIARLTQTFGQGVEYNDGRVFAEFARCAIEHKNIILKTKGETERCYISVNDAISAIFTILLSDCNGEAFNVANESNYCSIYDMAQLVAKDKNIDVVIEEQDITIQGYANKLYMDLDTTKLRSLGWEPKDDLKTMFDTLIESMEKTV